MSMTNLAISGIEQGLVPDPFVRAGIRRMVRQRLVDIHAGDAARSAEVAAAFVRELRGGPVALVPEKANAQHYEVPAEFFGHVLGTHRKYSACYWPAGVDDLDAAEAAALEVTCRRAGIADGQDILELGCGWGSLTLWMAARYPKARITAVSNSGSQRTFITAQARRRNLGNVQVITADMNAFASEHRHDRVVSVEMFEHMRNWPEMFRRVGEWLRPDGRFFMHVFTHRRTPYAFVERDPSDWMSRHFFSGGMMPSDDLALHFQDHLRLCDHWRWSGREYERTANAWLANMDDARAALWPILEATYGAEAATQWWMRWRVFFMSCAELFGYAGGEEWGVSHYLFEPRA
ncbi:MAG: class I SAM-dependent methyltransferase [Casimicrobiaceae bacterium]